MNSHGQLCPARAIEPSSPANMTSELVSHWSGTLWVGWTPWPAFPVLRLSVIMSDLKDSGARTQVLSKPELSLQFKVTTIGKLYLLLVGRRQALIQCRIYAESRWQLSGAGYCFLPHVPVKCFYTHWAISPPHPLTRGGINSDDRDWLGASQSTQHSPKNSNTITCWTRMKRRRRHRRQQSTLPGGQSGTTRSTAAQQDAVIKDFTLLWSCIPTRLLSLKLIVISILDTSTK